MDRTGTGARREVPHFRLALAQTGHAINLNTLGRKRRQLGPHPVVQWPGALAAAKNHGHLLHRIQPERRAKGRHRQTLDLTAHGHTDVANVPRPHTGEPDARRETRRANHGHPDGQAGDAIRFMQCNRHIPQPAREHDAGGSEAPKPDDAVGPFVRMSRRTKQNPAVAKKHNAASPADST